MKLWPIIKFSLMCDFQVPPEDYDSITDLVTTEEVHLIFYFLLHKDKRNIPSLWWNQIWIFSKARRDAKDVLLAVMGQADTLARCKLASYSPELWLQLSSTFGIIIILTILTIKIILTRCVNDCLRVSEEKEVVSDGAAGGSRFVDDDCDEDGLTMFE